MTVCWAASLPVMGRPAVCLCRVVDASGTGAGADMVDVNVFRWTGALTVDAVSRVNSFAYKDSVVVSAAFLLDVIKGLSEMTKFGRRPRTIEVGLGSRKGGGITGALVRSAFGSSSSSKAGYNNISTSSTPIHSHRTRFLNVSASLDLDLCVRHRDAIR